MIRYFLIPILVLSTHSIFSQELVNDTIYNPSKSILSTNVYKKGIYKSFIEFKNNEPSIQDSLYFDSENLWIVDSASGEKVKIKKDEVWGFCNGQTVYIWWNKYNPLIEMGRYCYFTEKGSKTMFNSPFGGFPISLIFFFVPLPYHQQNIFDFNDGEVYILRKNLMRELLEDDPDLRDEFERSRSKKEQFLKFIQLYNKRHEDQIEE